VPLGEDIADVHLEVLTVLLPWHISQSSCQ
jgi:hypothetical protein